MLMLNYEATQAESFRHGFIKGLAAPIMLFGSFQVPKTIDVITVEATQQQVANPLANDWAMVGHDLRSAISAYGQEK